MFKTKDFYLTAALLLHNFKIITHERDGAKFVFHFEDSEELQKIVHEYFYDELEVNPHLFQNAIKTVKSIMYV